jgi:hypothetical protein
MPVGSVRRHGTDTIERHIAKGDEATRSPKRGMQGTRKPPMRNLFKRTDLPTARDH